MTVAEGAPGATLLPGPLPAKPAAAVAGKRWWPHRLTVVVVVAGLVITGILSWTAFTAKNRNNQRLLRLEAQTGGLVLTSALPTLETPLASAAELAQATGGDPRQFVDFMAPQVGAGKDFASASLWSLQGPTPTLVAVAGSPSAAEQASARVEQFLAHAPANGNLSVSGIFGGPNARIGFGFVPAGSAHGYAVYGETPLSPGRYVSLQGEPAFADLNFALYLGRSPRRSALIEASSHQVPLTGATTSVVEPFGNSEFTFVASSAQGLGGTLTEDIWWLVGIVGIAMTLLVAAMGERLIRRRRTAEAVAAENEDLYAQQRDVAVALQRALIANRLPEIPGVEIEARYLPGVEVLEVGGDWYDVLQLDDHRLLLVVGDVSGRGLRAAVVMASLRYSLRAYALQGDGPAEVLTKLNDVIEVRRDGHFATIFCAVIDSTTREAIFVNAGHPSPLILVAGDASYLGGPIGCPVGVASDEGYVSTTEVLPPEATLLAFTDGLTERRGETIDVGLARLRRVAAGSDPAAPMADLLDALLDRMEAAGPADDVALLGVRWSSRA